MFMYKLTVNHIITTSFKAFIPVVTSISVENL